MVERVIKGVGPAFMAVASFNSLMLATEAAFLRLLDGDEVSGGGYAPDLGHS
jgi:hypothetical protein